jgi:hypothetical protein
MAKRHRPRSRPNAVPEGTDDSAQRGGRVGAALTVHDFGDVSTPDEAFRSDLQDAAKDYEEVDLVIELLQNALDAIDQRRYDLICATAGVDPTHKDTVNRWNQTVLKLLDKDYDDYTAAWAASPAAIAVASLYTKWCDDPQRREAWWQALAESFGSTPEALKRAVAPSQYKPALTVCYSQTQNWLEIQDNGVGMDLTRDSVLKYFRHKGSTKRRAISEKRFGERGSHGWGLTAVLAYTDLLGVVSRREGGNVAGWDFEGFRSFARGGPDPRPKAKSAAAVSEATRVSLLNHSPSGTVVRIVLQDVSHKNALGYTLEHYNPQRFVTFLRLFTPLAQVNDFVLHPAYHCYRETDPFDLAYIDADTGQKIDLRYSIMQLKERDPAHSFGFSQYQARTHDMQGNSVHTVHRHRNSVNLHVLTAAEIQETDLFSKVEKGMRDAGMLTSRTGEHSGEEIPRGFYLAHSGGMLSSAQALGTQGNNAMFRGVALADQSPPALARKHITTQLDGRSTIPRAAKEHTSRYDNVRKQVKTSSGSGGGPAVIRARREYFDKVLEELAVQPTSTPSLAIWAGNASREARVMMMFGELLAKSVFGDLRVLRCGLRDQYDFGFLYRARVGTDPVPSNVIAASLRSEGWAELSGTGELTRLGIGEFKADGEDIFDDFDPLEPLKNAKAIDLLVCWDFDREYLDSVNWDVEEVVDDSQREFQHQTHKWSSQGNAEHRRDRPLAVISLSSLQQRLVDLGVIQSASATTGIRNYY